MRETVKKTSLTENCSKEDIRAFVDAVIPKLTTEEKIGIMSGQITDMEKQLLRQKQNRMERKVLLITLLVFCGIILIGAYQLAMSFLSSVSGIMG